MFLDKLKHLPKNKGKLVLALLALVVASEFSYLVSLNVQDGNAKNIFAGMVMGFSFGSIHTVELREDGFFPRQLTIKKGDTVKFITKMDKPFWPASSVHPDHNIYPEFDPRKPIESNEAWSFRFNKEGEWEYHDHLNPLYSGVIIAGKESLFSRVDCKQNEPRCWQETIENALAEGGIEGGFFALSDLYDNDPSFRSDCHGYTHIIGEEASSVFARGEDMALTTKASYCGYGFYHGFMETLLQTTGDLSQAREFCDYVDKQLASQNPGAWRACSHGIGHGTVDGSDPRTWGDAEAMIAEGLRLCEILSSEEFQKDLCASGVFNSLAIMHYDPKYKLEINNADPYWICQKQTVGYFKKPCYEEMNTLTLRSSGNDFSKASFHVENIEESEYAVFAIQSLAAYASSFAIKDASYREFIATCQSLSEHLKIPCVAGFAAGLLEHGPPEREYVAALDYCASEMLTEKEKEACYKRLLGGAWHLYSSQKYQDICNLVAREYKRLCN
ncbi:hypothetical protein IID21_03545 [Patescibacteria group bacterium]|nr:hypothetical protein [Patescibacteria group bacterium]